MKSISENRGPICPMCNIVQIKLVPLYNDDHQHKKQMCCVNCKRAIKNGQPIVKIDRSKLVAGE